MAKARPIKQKWGRIPPASVLKAESISNLTNGCLSITKSHDMISKMSPTILDAKITVNPKTKKKRIRLVGLYEFDI